MAHPFQQRLKNTQGCTRSGGRCRLDESNLWAGLVPHYGSSAITLVGSPQDLADAFMEYKRIGVTQFIIAGWPKLDEMMIFGREVIPLVREAEPRE